MGVDIAETYRAFVRSGTEHFPMHVLKRLTFERWHKDFQKELELDQQPILRDWYSKKFSGLPSSPNDDPDDWLSGFVALAGLLKSRFHGLELPIPKKWIQNSAFAHETYCLFDVGMVDYFRTTDLDEQFDSGSKPLRKQLAAEFTQLFLSKLKETIESVDSKSTIEAILDRNQKLRAMLDESSYYESSPLYRTFQEKLPEFIERFSKSKDPAVNFVLQMLHQTFVDYEAISDYKLFLNLFREYFKAADVKKHHEILEAEMMSYLKMLLSENRRLNQKIKMLEG